MTMSQNSRQRLTARRLREAGTACQHSPTLLRRSIPVLQWRIGPACCGQLYRCRYRRKATKPKHEIQPTDIVLFDNNACSMVVCGFYSDSFMGYTAKAYCQNKTDDRIDVILDKGSINGFECTPEGAALLEPHSNAYVDIRWQEYAETYAENGNDPTSITKIVMPVFVRKDTGSNTVYIDATYSIDPQARTATPIVNPQ